MSKKINDNIPGYLRDILSFSVEPNAKNRDLYHKVVQHWFAFHLFQALSAQYGMFNIHRVAKSVDVKMASGDEFKADYLKTPGGKLTGFGYTLQSNAFKEEGHGPILAERIAADFSAYVTHLFSDTDKLSAVSRELVDGVLTIHVTWSQPWEAMLTTGDKA